VLMGQCFHILLAAPSSITSLSQVTQRCDRGHPGGEWVSKVWEGTTTNKRLEVGIYCHYNIFIFTK
ncbi:hypothetical protein XENOCAPTIV_024327, partial [Xenoophorus captivus]